MLRYMYTNCEGYSLTITNKARFILPANANAKRTWREFDVTPSFRSDYSQGSRAEGNCCELFIVNLWRQDPLRIRIRRKYEPGFSCKCTFSECSYIFFTTRLKSSNYPLLSLAASRSSLACSQEGRRTRRLERRLSCCHQRRQRRCTECLPFTFTCHRWPSHGMATRLKLFIIPKLSHWSSVQQ